MTYKQIDIANISVSNNLPLVLFGGLNVLESRDLTLSVAENFKATCAELGVPLVFKASFDKANRSSINSFRGPGLEEGLNWLAEVKSQFNMTIITDIHEPDQAAAVSEIAEVLQLPAFLSRQTDLIVAMAKTGAAINIKKAQFLAPREMLHVLKKFESEGNQRLMLCERGSSFGYNNLVVDMLGFSIMKQFDYPVIFEVTHALQKPGGLANSADGRRQQVTALAKAGLSQGIAGLFLEAHPDPDNALCDCHCALRLDQLKPFLRQMQELDGLIKSQPDIDTA